MFTSDPQLVQQFIQLSKQDQQHHNKTLLNILENNKNTIVYKNKGFDTINNIEEFKQKATITTYKDYEEYTKRVCENNDGDVFAPGVLVIVVLFVGCSGCCVKIAENNIVEFKQKTITNTYYEEYAKRVC